MRHYQSYSRTLCRGGRSMNYKEMTILMRLPAHNEVMPRTKTAELHHEAFLSAQGWLGSLTCSAFVRNIAEYTSKIVFDRGNDHGAMARYGALEVHGHSDHGCDLSILHALHCQCRAVACALTLNCTVLTLAGVQVCMLLVYTGGHDSLCGRQPRQTRVHHPECEAPLIMLCFSSR